MDFLDHDVAQRSGRVRARPRHRRRGRRADRGHAGRGRRHRDRAGPLSRAGGAGLRRSPCACIWPSAPRWRPSFRPRSPRCAHMPSAARWTGRCSRAGSSRWWRASPSAPRWRAYVNGRTLSLIFGIVALPVAVNMAFGKESWRLAERIPPAPAGWSLPLGIGWLSTHDGDRRRHAGRADHDPVQFPDPSRGGNGGGLRRHHLDPRRPSAWPSAAGARRACRPIRSAM